MKKFLLILLIASAFIASGSIYIIDQTQQALLLQFGEPVDVIEKGPGLHFKRPFFLQNVVKFEKRILDLNAVPREVIASDQKRLIVDAFAKYKIVDPLKFYQTVRNEYGIRTRLNSILDSRLREVLGNHPLNTLLTGEREKLMRTIRDNVNAEVKSFGIDVVDVRIMRADLPEKNSLAIFRRMNTEREREAKELRAQGAEEAQRITSRAERDKTVLLANASKKSQILRGEGDAEATKIFANAFGKDEEFYSFYRSMQAYRGTLTSTDTTMVLSPDSEFLKYFSNIDGKYSE